MNTTWKEALQHKSFIYGLTFTCCSLLILSFFMPFFFREVIAGKGGTVLNDFILEWLPARDWSWTIFTLVYSSAVLAIANNYKNPRVMLLGLATYSGVTWLRMLTIYFFTLDPPRGIIFLRDPFLSLIVYPQNFTKDLFFSGHVSTMTVFILMEAHKKIKLLIIVATIIVGILLMIQHVHYALDVLVAPVFTYLVYRWVLQVQPTSSKLKQT